MKKLKTVLAGLGAAVLLVGCCVTAEPAPGPTVAETAPTVTEAAQESVGFTFGDIAWSLWEDYEGQIRLSRHAVVAQEGDYLTVTTCVTDDPDVLRQVLPEYLESMEQDHPGECLTLMLVSECYATEAEAQAVADAMNEEVR